MCNNLEVKESIIMKLPNVWDRVGKAVLTILSVWSFVITIFAFQSIISIPTIKLRLCWLIIGIVVLAIIILIPYIRIHYLKKEYRAQARIEEAKLERCKLVLYAKRHISVTANQVVAIRHRFPQDNHYETIGLGTVESTDESNLIRVVVFRKSSDNSSVWTDLKRGTKRALENTMISVEIPRVIMEDGEQNV